MKFSWNQCTRFAQVAQNYVERNKSRETKLIYAINRVIARIQKEQPKVTDALADIDIDHCVTGEGDVILRDAQGGLQYTKENLKARNAARTKYTETANVEIEPYFATKLPDDLNVFEVEAFSGLVIRAEEADSLIAAIEAKAGTDDGAEAAAAASA